jgi:hypothetical protein
MRTKFALVLLLGGLCVQPAAALGLNNLRASNGPMGAKRADDKYLPGDAIYLSFDIENIQVDPKTGGAVYQTTLEIANSKGEVVLKPIKSPQQKVILLGGNQIRSNAFTLLGTKQDPGLYKMKVTVDDVLAKASKTLIYEFEVLPLNFGFVQPNVAGIAFAGGDYTVGFSLVGMKKDKKTKLPEVKVTLRILDATGKEVTVQPWTLDVAEVFHNPPLVDLTEKEVVPVYFLLFLNRPGTYTITVEAEDQIGKEKRQMTFPLKVLDLGETIGK